MDSRCGISMIFVGFWSLLPPPTWNAENEHGWHVSHCASAAEIFIGWYVASMTPRWLPTPSARKIDGRSTAIETLAERVNTSVWWPRRRYQADTASMSTEPVTSEAVSTCAYPQRNTGFVITAPMSDSCGRPVDSSRVYPTGFCIHEFAAMMNAADPA